MDQRRWVNQTQPETLYIATIILYIRAVLGLLFSPGPFGLAFAAAFAAGGFGIANEKRWGYFLAVIVASFAAILTLLSLLSLFSLSGVGSGVGRLMINLLFDGALVAALLHQRSWEYVRIWFR